MNIVDILIIIFLISALFRGREVGFVRQLFSAIGFFGGLWIGASLIEPHTVQLVHSALSRSLVTIFTTLGTALIFLAMGEYAGIMLRHRIYRWHVEHVDNVLGSLIAVVSLLATVWLSAAVLVTLPFPSLQRDIRGSAIISKLNTSLPAAPTVIADLGRLIDPNGFPEVFTGSEPAPRHIPLPNMGALTAAVRADEDSVVKIEGQGCGGVVEGSGFVVGSDFVATNAHVIAGINKPYVIDANGTHTGTPVWFDPDLDFAVLRVSNLAGKPLVFDTNHISPGTPAAFLGYPGGGDFSAKAAAVLNEFTATGRNIYNQGDTERDVYEINGDVIPGNSGGPLITKDGSVIGVIFAESTTYNHVGYALAVDQIIAEIHQAEAQNQPVGTGNCAE